jgi:hypothetical protein
MFLVNLFFKTAEKLKHTQGYVTVNRQILPGLQILVPTDRPTSNTNQDGICYLRGNSPQWDVCHILYYKDCN